MRAFDLFAPAKVNLCLHVVGRRPDGYHLLESVAAFAALGDGLRFEPADTLVLERDGPEAGALPPAGEDIVLRAARALAACADVPARARLRLTKRLPVGAGLGGGSSDAAAALLGLCRLWALDPDALDLPGLALSLGADVPVCLAGRSAIMRGIGEALTFLPPLPAASLVLVNPRQPAATAEVFRRFAALPPRRPPALPALDPMPADAVALAEALARGGNDLTAAASTLVPAIEDALAVLAGAPGCLLARMSGSGATCFGLFAEPLAAHAAAMAVRGRRPGWWVEPTELRSVARGPT